MCGLVGIAGDCSGHWKDVFNELLLFDVVRGPHSTGAGFVRRDKHETFTLVKRPGNPFNVFDTPEFQQNIDRESNKVILGHNRFATVGEKTEANAHPFAFEHIMGMHNGTLDKSCLKDLVGHDKYGTDSEAIFATLNEKNITDTVELISGAWALVWFDRTDGTINFLRNDRRPLHYCYSEDRSTLIWASELDMLKYVMGRHNKKALDNSFFITNPDIHYSWEIPNSILGKFEPPKNTKVEGKQYNYAPFVFKDSQTKNTSNSSSHSNRNYFVADDEGDEFLGLNTAKFRPPYKDRYGKVLKKPEFFKMIEDGCAFCNSNDIEWGEFIHIMGAYIGPHTAFACEACYNDADIQPYAKYAV